MMVGGRLKPLINRAGAVLVGYEGQRITSLCLVCPFILAWMGSLVSGLVYRVCPIGAN